MMEFSKTTPHRACRDARRASSGFSLVEMLAVILVISILMTVGVMGIKNLSGGKSTQAAVASSEGLFEEARLIAVGRGTTARLLVNTDQDKKNTPEYLRRLLVAFKDPENGQWQLANRGYLMPEGIYFSQEFSKKDFAGAQSQLDTESMTFPQNDYSGNYSYYEFNSEGICTSPGASFIVGSGARPPSGDPRVTGSSRDFSGFVVWRNGHTSKFRSPKQMKLPTTLEKF
jgi:prepilin-type N-terminal cleavage/methylation domain-containing protein